ncbi:MAG: methyltransferase domain-containing protein, partial [Alphaproteobacteria bacterium]|nr:methyltransferase domain-containing protein [Alphaproteobacteria bacterium]
AERWPDHRVTGVDSSAEMLAAAAATPAKIAWAEADIAAWSAAEPAALIFSNAALHWLDEHAALFPRLMRELAPGGILAVQMPRNHASPSHRLMHEIATAPPWAAKLAPLLRPDPVASPDFYYDLLAPLARGGIDLWETLYLHVLGATPSGESPVLTWVRSTALRPLLAALDPSEQAAFTQAFDARLKTAYPARADGKVLFPFRRLFIVARG